MEEWISPGETYALTLFTTTGDRDLQTSLSTLDKTDFFTKEIDRALLEGEIDLALHSAKDLPDPLPEGLAVIELTEGIDASDSLVYNTLPETPIVGVSSPRRIEVIKTLYPHAICKEIRGTIEHRLAQLDRGDYDAIIVAEAALIRLHLTSRKRIPLPGETAPLQGKLAVVTSENTLLCTSSAS